ncbi:hypothetical protein TNIN_267081 [Trichonephila inaurata madagascariensis]|uniref:Uncharacterized protein n=1 Tax=Trichonephila inaurata madagascariensis TaxID=2747483 RepID=A0A8X6XL30_9ARAC|nr:hypothetical protein TNIN_267081 [Trichonephila inaurata madagascariensis]
MTQPELTLSLGMNDSKLNFERLRRRRFSILGVFGILIQEQKSSLGCFASSKTFQTPVDRFWANIGICDERTTVKLNPWEVWKPFGGFLEALKNIMQILINCRFFF